METEKSVYSFSNAVADLQSAGFQAEPKAYGFSVVLHDTKGKYQIQCGHEHDGEISISVDSGTPPVRWFLRPTIREMVSLLIEADKLLRSGQASNWIDALNKIEPMIL